MVLNPDEPLFGIPKDKWLQLPKQHREEGHRLAKGFEDACKRLGIEPRY